MLEPPRDVDEYARVLYARLREADALGLDVVARGPAARRTGSVPRYVTDCTGPPPIRRDRQR